MLRVAIAALAAFALPLAGQSAPASPAGPAAAPADVASPDAIIAATYAAISGPAGPRQWDRFLSLFAPGARLIPTGCNQQGQCGGQVWSPEEYVERVGNGYFATNPFYEVGIKNVEERYGSIAHVFSTYESRNDPSDPEPFVRGINSFQLRYDGTRWWVMSIMWIDTNSAGAIPARYLP